MTALTEASSRPEFETVDLDVAVEDARRTIQDTVRGLSETETDEGLTYRTRDGMLVAILGPRPSGSGDVKASLAYRTEPATDGATRKARKLREALASHSIHG